MTDRKQRLRLRRWRNLMKRNPEAVARWMVAVMPDLADAIATDIAHAA